jgi:hypothetical protein
MATVTKDFRVKHGLVVEGTNATVNASDIITEDAITGGTQTNITVTYNPTTKVVNFAAENGVADSNTDALAEGTTNKYFTDERAQDAVGNAVGTGLTYNDTSGAISVTTNTYDAYGSASAVAGDLTTHTSATEAHGATGAVVGTTNTQTLTNKTLTSPKINEDVALTATATELNVLDGITATTAELNTLDGITATVAELNVLDGITSTVAELNILDGVTSTAAELNILDGVTATTTELNYVDGVTSAIQTQLDAKLDESGGTMTGNIAMGTNKITGLGAPTDSTDAATKAYVDAAVEGLHVHEAARVAVQGNISIATGLENGDTAGGVTLATGDRVLIKDQTNTAENGIYVVQASGQALRATDFDTATEIDSGDFIFVSAGTYANTGWVQTLKPATIGTDPLQFTQFSGAGTFTAGNGLTLDGTEFSIDDTITATKTYVDETFVTLDDLPGELDDYVLLTQKGAIDGVATLDGTAQVPLNQLENVTDVIDALTTADVAEDFSNQYYTDQKVKDVLTGSTQTNISITEVSGALVITAENGVADSDTDDLAEGATNLYFTDTRAVDALEAVVPNFTAVDINNVAKEVAVSGIPTAGSPTAVLSWDSATFPSLKAIVMFRTSTHTEISEILLTMDSSNNFAVTEYAVVGTNGTLGTIEPEYYGAGSGSALKATTVNSGTTVTIKATLLNPYTV